MNKIKDVIDNRLCLGCGLCGIEDSIKMKYSYKLGQYVPVISTNKQVLENNMIDICPGKGYRIKKISESLYDKYYNKYSLELGYVNNQYLSHTVDNQILKNASSGGIITQIIFYLLDKNIVDKALVTKFIYTPKGPRTNTVLTNSKEEILNSQGSKYCPVDMSEIIGQLIRSKDKIVFVGIPCQIAGIRMLQKKYEVLKDNIVLTISNFCGGFKSYNNIEKIAGRNGIDYKNISFFRFRGGGQPGSMLMRDNHGHSVSIDYPKYTRLCGLSKHLRCHLCVDATGELADISCGDAWLKKDITDRYPWSIILTRTSFSSKIINDMINNNIIVCKSISTKKIIESQKKNIESKKYRQKARMKLYSFLNITLAKFDGGYSNNISSLKTEIFVFLKHKLHCFLEFTHLFWLTNIFKKGKS